MWAKQIPDKSLNSPNVFLSCFKFVYSSEVSNVQTDTRVSIIRLLFFCGTFTKSFTFLASFPQHSESCYWRMMNIIKCDFHQREIWYVYRFNGLSEARKTEETQLDTFSSNKLKFLLHPLKFFSRFVSFLFEKRSKCIAKAKNMFKYLKTL